jgi:hypothetical protein
MAFADIRTQVKAALESIDGIGVVSDFEPWVKRIEDLREFFQPENEDILRGWTISRENVQESAFNFDANWARHAIVVRGYLALADKGATERTFQDLVDVVTERFRLEQRNHFLETVDYVEPPLIRTIEVHDFSNTLVHYCEIVIACRESVAVAA